jgi:hypothetical protein
VSDDTEPFDYIEQLEGVTEDEMNNLFKSWSSSQATAYGPDNAYRATEHGWGKWDLHLVAVDLR